MGGRVWVHVNITTGISVVLYWHTVEELLGHFYNIKVAEYFFFYIYYMTAL